MKALAKEDVLESIFKDPTLMSAIEAYDPKADAVVLRSSPRLQAKGQRWASHAILVKSDENVRYPFQIVACHQNLGGGAGFNTFDYWTVGFPNLEMAAQAFCDVQNFNTPYLGEVIYDTSSHRFRNEPNPGRLEFDAIIDVSKPSHPATRLPPRHEEMKYAI
jgi:hypothetical protein